MHWDGTSWTQIPSANWPTPGGNFYSQQLDAVVAIAPNDVWAVGYYRIGNTPHPLVQHWNGTQWSIIPVPDGPTGDGWLQGIAASGPNDIWAVGKYDMSDFTSFGQALAMHWNGSNWTVSIPPQPNPSGVNPLYSVVARGPNDFYAVGQWENSSQGLDTFIAHWNGVNWTRAPSENPPGTGTGWNELKDVARDGKGGLWAVGTGQASFGSPFFTLVEKADISGLPSPTPVASATPTPPALTDADFFATPGGTPTITPTPSPTVSPTSTPAPSVSPTAAPSASPTPTPSPNPSATPTPPPSPARPLNISTRARVEVGENIMIAGFVITGNAPRRVYLRAIGPSLASAGVNGFLVDPVLRLFASNGTQLTSNDDWQDTQAAEITATGIPPGHELESAIVTTLAPGDYSATMAGTNGLTGIGLVEVYDLGTNAGSRLANISTRARVQTQDNVLIAGFILGGGNEPTRVAVRALGPSVGAAGISNALPDPRLELRDQNGALLLANNNWQDDPAQAAQILNLGLAPPDNLESAIVTTLAPGTYTAIVAGQGGTTGVGLVEVYHVP